MSAVPLLSVDKGEGRSIAFIAPQGDHLERIRMANRFNFFAANPK